MTCQLDVGKIQNIVKYILMMKIDFLARRAMSEVPLLENFFVCYKVLYGVVESVRSE